MLYLLHGSHREKAKARYLALINSALAEESARPHLRLQPETVTRAVLEEQAVARSLFGSRALVSGEGLFEKETARAMLVELAPMLHGSVQLFVFLEEKMPAEVVKQLTSYAKMEAFQAPYAKADEKLAYAFLDALATRNKRLTWVAFERARRAGFADEQLFWKLVNQVKQIVLIGRGLSQEELGIKYDFVYQKSVAATKRFTDQGLVAMHADLVRLFHDSHRNSEDFGINLERWVLGV